MNIDPVSVRFTKNVSVAADDLQVFGAPTPNLALNPAAFSYDAATFTATGAFRAPVGADQLRLNVDGTATGVTADGGKPLDGEWADGTARFASGDGAPGGDLAFHLNAQPGDVVKELASSDSLLGPHGGEGRMP
jgi:hypothetical protein